MIWFVGNILIICQLSNSILRADSFDCIICMWFGCFAFDALFAALCAMLHNFAYFQFFHRILSESFCNCSLSISTFLI